MKKQKQPVVGTKEYHDQLIKHYAGRATWLVQCKGNLNRDDLELTAIISNDRSVDGDRFYLYKVK